MIQPIAPAARVSKVPLIARSGALFVALLCLLTLPSFDAIASPAPMPKLVKSEGHFALFVNNEPFLMLGVQVNNSSAWPAMLPKVWPAVEAVHANTVEMPVYWEQLEPTPDQFDYTVVDTLITQARQHSVHLVLLWFGTWKNGSSHYEPIWMKENPSIYPRMLGVDGQPVDSPSPFAPATLAADIKAFSALMAHLKAVDPERTVIMVQVENETGTWGSVRDYSPTAQKLFDAPVPDAVIKALNPPAYSPGQNWTQAFGPEAEIFFHGWYVASYVGKVAAAGKAIYALPMYVNAALRDPITPGPPGSYESGGPTDDLIPIWKAAAPAIDILSPDIYIGDYTKYVRVLELYSRTDNALFVPETRNGPTAAPFLFAAIGHGAIGYSPFGVDLTRFATVSISASGVNDFLQPLAEEYAVIAPMDQLIAELNFQGRVQAIAEDPTNPAQDLDFGDWTADVTFGGQHFGYGKNPPPGNPTPIGRALVAQLGPDQFLVTAFYGRIDFTPKDPSKHRQFMQVQEGVFKKGIFTPIRIWNGDQTDRGLNFDDSPAVLRVSLGTY